MAGFNFGSLGDIAGNAMKSAMDAASTAAANKPSSGNLMNAMAGNYTEVPWVSRYEDDDDGYYYVIDLIR